MLILFSTLMNLSVPGVLSREPLPPLIIKIQSGALPDPHEFYFLSRGPFS